MDQVKDIHCLDNLKVCFLDSGNSGIIVQEVAKSSLIKEVKKKASDVSYLDANQG